MDQQVEENVVRKTQGKKTGGKQKQTKQQNSVGTQKETVTVKRKTTGLEKWPKA